MEGDVRDDVHHSYWLLGTFTSYDGTHAEIDYPAMQIRLELGDLPDRQMMNGVASKLAALCP